jgi:uncharacterized C2H2 Zn-finger protein
MRVIERKNKQMAPAATKAKPAAATAELTCPECGKTFTRAASLGAHRNRAHGVSGAAAKRKPSARRAAAKPATAASSRSRSTRRAAATGASATTRRSSSTPRNGASGIDRDALLQALFPNGIPARESVLSQVNSWLAEGERLARLAGN